MTRAATGKASRNKGAKIERDLAAWLRHNGWPHAERGRNNGFATTSGRCGPDRFDIDGCPGLLWDAKATTDRPWLIPDWLADVANEAAGRGLLGILVVKRAGHADPGRWWAWLRACDLFHVAPMVTQFDSPAPVAIELGHLAPILHSAGYGEAIDDH